MKWIWYFTVLAGLAFGCSKQSPPKSELPSPPAASNGPGAARPKDLIIVELDETKEKQSIYVESARLLTSKSYDALEGLASKYRSTKECYADGDWKLKDFYTGLEPTALQSDSDWSKRLGELKDWVQARPKSNTARCALATTLISYGWKARGAGYANTVSDQGQTLFESRLRQAQEVLQEATAVDPRCPRWWSLALKCNLGLGLDKAHYRQVFDKAVEAEPQCSSYYFQMAYYLLPRWHGQPKDTATFLQTEADKIGGKEGDVLYARVAWMLQGIEGNIFLNRGLSWERTDRGLQILQERDPKCFHIQSARAYLAVMGCRKPEVTRGLINAMGGKIDLRTWTSFANFRRLTDPLYGT